MDKEVKIEKDLKEILISKVTSSLKKYSEKEHPRILITDFNEIKVEPIKDIIMFYHPAYKQVKIINYKI
jgi:hypothetical protein